MLDAFQTKKQMLNYLKDSYSVLKLLAYINLFWIYNNNYNCYFGRNYGYPWYIYIYFLN